MGVFPGSRIGPYSVRSEIGRGGMGVVYLARDTRLERDVAIKALPSSLAGNADRLARFEREARTLAQLNHPNVAGIHGTEELDGDRYLVLEYVEGETLAERLAGGALPVEDALQFAAQIAAGVEAAHEAGIVHRDLKPANIKITPAGQVKVLDLGLARMDPPSLPAADLSASPTVARGPHSPTMPGVILGTAGYMSPEQARGKPVDRRSDIWSFGVILYEMLTGANPFAGETASDSIAAVLQRDPDLHRLPPSLPVSMRLLLRRCLARDAARRLKDIGDARVEIEDVVRDPAGALQDAAAAARSGGAEAARADHRRPAGRAGWLALAAALPLAAVALFFGLQALSGPEAPDGSTDRERPVVRYELARPSIDDMPGPAAISPDGTRVAYVDAGGLWLRDLAAFEARPLPGTEGGRLPFWSPDGEWIAFGVDRGLLKVPARGGPPQPICTMPRAFVTLAGSGAWLEDGSIIFASGQADLLRVSSGGGQPSVWLQTDVSTAIDLHHVTPLPGDAGVLYVAHAPKGGWRVMASDGARRSTILAGGLSRPVWPVYSPPGVVLFSQEGATPGVWGVRFSLQTLTSEGEPFLVAAGGRNPAVSGDGTLTYVVADEDRGGVLAWFPLDGGRPEPFGEPMAYLRSPELSPDGRSIAHQGGLHSASGVWIYDLERGRRTRLTSDTDFSDPAWSPDGTRIATARPGADPPAISFFSVDDGAEIGTPVPGTWLSFDPEWTSAAVERPGADGRFDIWYVPLAGSGEERPLLASPAEERWARVSPDGRWLLYRSDESGENEAYLTRYPSGEGRWQVSTDGAQALSWGPDSRNIYYISPEQHLMRASLETDPRVVVGRPERLLDRDDGMMFFRGWSIPPPGDRALSVMRAPEAEDTFSIRVVHNWAAEFGVLR